MLDWREVGWWDLPGPSRFIEKVASAVLSGDQGAFGLLLPMPQPDGLLDALSRRISEGAGTIPIRLDASDGLRGRSPAHMLAAGAGVAASAVRSVAEFLDAPGLTNAFFIVDGIPADEWITWGMFLRGQRSEHGRRPRPMAPAICLVVPNSVAPDDVKAALGGRSLRWIGAISRLDSQLYAEWATGFSGEDLVSNTAVSTITEVAGWDRSLIRALAKLPIELQLDPRQEFAKVAIDTEAAKPCWANGLVDHWDGQVFVHTKALLATRSSAVITRRVWRAHVRTIFPFIEQVRHAYVSKYDLELRKRLPISKTYHSTIRTYADPLELELYDVFQLLKEIMPRLEQTLLFDCYKLRTSIAHMEPGESSRICRASHLWDDHSNAFPDGCRGWDWPRCGQRLVLMVGPARGGKTTWIEHRFEVADVVSSDKICEEIYRCVDARRNSEPVLRRIHQDVVARLSSGRTAVIDANNLQKQERLANALLAPSDMTVDYVVIDRPMDEKITGGSRSHWPDSLENEAAIFEGGLQEILAGDGLSNVRLIDERKVVKKDANGLSGDD